MSKVDALYIHFPYCRHLCNYCDFYKMKSPVISILMPVKNTHQFLKECLDSIINQTETNWELIAIDDHSSDGSATLLNDYAIKDKRVNVYENNGNGIINALRLAYSESRGDLITRMDSDDIMVPEKLTVLKQNLIASGKGNIVVGLVKYFSEKPLGDGFKKYELWLNELTIVGKNFDGIYKECVIPSPCWMVFREDLNSCDACQKAFYQAQNLVIALKDIPIPPAKTGFENRVLSFLESTLSTKKRRFKCAEIT